VKIKLLSPALLATLLVVANMGCASHPVQHTNSKPPQPALKAAPATPIAEKKEELGGATWDPQWDVVVEKDLPPELLSGRAARAVRSYCPRFGQESEADKRAFWAYVFQALAGAEAGLNATSDVHHLQQEVNVQDKVSLRPVHQEGLLQLTYQDSDRYGCDFDWKKDRKLPEHDPNRTILQPANNLACGVKIMENQIITQGKPLLARTSYWATLQPGTASYRVFAKQMANVPAACGTRPQRPRTHAQTHAQSE
jgi:hypothetical protein